jgi:putative redox protein
VSGMPELFDAALAGCVAFYAGRYLTRLVWGPNACGEYGMAADRPARVAAVRAPAGGA